MGAPNEDSGIRKYKVILVGNERVGKSSLMRRGTMGKFEKVYKHTIGVDFYTKDLISDEKRVQLILWDFGGQDVFVGIRQAYYKDAHAIIMAYDTTNRESFEKLDKWINECNENVRKGRISKKVPIIIVGTKMDVYDILGKHFDEKNLPKKNSIIRSIGEDEWNRIKSQIENNEDRRVNVDEAIEYAKKNKADFVETSSKLDNEISRYMGLNVEAVLYRAAHLSMCYEVEAGDLILDDDFIKKCTGLVERELEIPKRIKGNYCLLPIKETRLV